MLSDKSKNLLKNMRIDSDVYFRTLDKKFGSDSSVFCQLINHFDSDSKVGDACEFNNFWNEQYPKTSCDGELCNWAYELYNNIRCYFADGVFEVFKKRQSEWGAPRINIRKEDILFASDVDSLDITQTIYRGLSEAEHVNRNYAQSWTTDINVAKKFSLDTYADEPSGIVVKAEISRQNIIYYDSSDAEKEVITEEGAVYEARRIYQT